MLNNNHCSKTLRYSGMSSLGHYGYAPFFSKKTRFLEPDDEMWLYPCNNKDDWVSKEIRRIFGFDTFDKDQKE